MGLKDIMKPEKDIVGAEKQLVAPKPAKKARKF